MRSFQHVFPAFALALTLLLFISKASSQPADPEASTSSVPAYLFTNFPLDGEIYPSREMRTFLSNQPSYVKTGRMEVISSQTNTLFEVKMGSQRSDYLITHSSQDRSFPMPRSMADVNYYLCIIIDKPISGKGQLRIDTVQGHIRNLDSDDSDKKYCQKLEPDIRYKLTMVFDETRLQGSRRLGLLRNPRVGSSSCQSFQYAVIYHPKQ